MRKATVIGMVIIALLFFIIFFQNTQSAETKLLFVTVKMPIVILLMLTVLAASLAGLSRRAVFCESPAWHTNDRTQTECSLKEFCFSFGL